MTWIRIHKILRFGMLRRFKRGATITIYPTLRCNLDCHYCSQKIYNGLEPAGVREDELEVEQWIGLLKRFMRHVKVQQVHYTGGEPLLRKDCAELVNWLTAQGIFVTIYSNLTIFDSVIKPSLFLRFDTTYHHHMNKERYLKNLKKYKDSGFNMYVHELGHRELKETDEVREYEPLDAGTGGMTDRLSFAPDGSMFVWQRMMYEYLFRTYDKKNYLGKFQSWQERQTERKKNR